MPESKWTRKNIVPRGDMLHWGALDDLTSGIIAELPDFSGNDRTLLPTINEPQIQEDVLNGLPGLYFDGTNNPLADAGAFNAKHIFVVCAAEEATFTGHRGLVSGMALVDALTGADGTDKFYDLNLSAFGDYQYKKANRAFDEDAQAAPMNGSAAVIEIQAPFGLSFDGLQIGQQRDLTDRKWKGWFFEDLIFSSIKDDCDRKLIYEYFARKFHLWEESETGLYIFPFVANKTRSIESDIEHYASTPYSGPRKALVRGGMKDRFEIPFLLRSQDEYEAAKEFHRQHYPLTHFIFRDYRFYPFKEKEVEITSSLREQGSDISFRFNYSFEVAQARIGEIPELTLVDTDEELLVDA